MDLLKALTAQINITISKNIHFQHLEEVEEIFKFMSVQTKHTIQ